MTRNRRRTASFRQEAFHDAVFKRVERHHDQTAAIAQQVLALYERRTSYDAQALRSLIVGQHDLHSFARKLVAQMQAMP